MFAQRYFAAPAIAPSARRVARALALCTLACGAAWCGPLAGRADALATVKIEDHQVHYHGGGSANRIEIVTDRDGDGNESAEFVERAEGFRIAPRRGCTTEPARGDGTRIECALADDSISTLFLNLGAGDDSLHGRCSTTGIGLGIQVSGGAGNDDFLTAALGSIIGVEGGPGADTFRDCPGGITGWDGGRGRDWMASGDRKDYLNGGPGADVLRAGPDPDSLLGFFGNDTLNAGAGNDHVRGYAGDDSLRGGIGDDRLDGHKGTDALVCGEDFDRFVIDPLDDVDPDCEDGVAHHNQLFER